MERTPVERYLAENEVGENPLIGEPLPMRARLGRVELDRYLPALGGPLPHMHRLRRIDDETAAQENALAEAWHALAAEHHGDSAGFSRRWRRIASEWDFTGLNELIARHNAYYPAEARLPMDPRSGDYVLVLGRPYKRERLDRRWILERFPPELAAAAEAA
ncbi:MAG: hypothetical protein M3321_11330 [Actinomycetota bacterium]|nr:hypothetical protein [Actinomycetota bacterium]